VEIIGHAGEMVRCHEGTDMPEHIIAGTELSPEI
jgi:hypothetical protein